jgi:hypothetical protein
MRINKARLRHRDRIHRGPLGQLIYKVFRNGRFSIRFGVIESIHITRGPIQPDPCASTSTAAIEEIAHEKEVP